jgi:hypothetical protein
VRAVPRIDQLGCYGGFGFFIASMFLWVPHRKVRSALWSNGQAVRAPQTAKRWRIHR